MSLPACLQVAQYRLKLAIDFALGAPLSIVAPSISRVLSSSWPFKVWHPTSRRLKTAPPRRKVLHRSNFGNIVTEITMYRVSDASLPSNLDAQGGAKIQSLASKTDLQMRGVTIYRNELYRNGPQRTTMIRNGSRQTATDYNGPQWSATDHNGSQWTATDHNGPQWTEVG